MSAARPNKDEIFNTAAELPDDEQRQAYLAEVCEGDADLRREIEELLEQDRAAGSFLESPPTGLDVTVSSPILAKPGTQIGPYQLLERIGHGGMGVVYLAEQTQPVRRRVALKIIKPGMDTQQVIRRFEAERQALALMDHPNIARVLDAGETESGRPYFVMEWVKGVPITQYCDEHQLTPRERLEIFATVCQAVQHSHQKGIIHRDIKPSNVLVSERDGRPVAKVIDFGLAKAMGPQLIGKTVFTQQGQIVGTVEYMSPEQADLNPVDIDTRTDIYSLGVLLYELLTGETPFDRTRLRSAAYNEILRIIREEEPPRPSIRLSSSEALPSIAANRHCEPRKLSTLMRGELDWIVMKALEKDRSRRYETANGFARDVNRYLSDEPVVACPPSKRYRFRKWIRRNKELAVTTALIAATLLLGVIGTTWQAWNASRQRDRAVTAEGLANVRLNAEQAARIEAEAARNAESVARAAAEQASDERRKSLVRQYVRRGTEFVDRADHTTALPWFLKALELDRDDPERERIHQLRIMTTLDHCPKLTSILHPSHRVDSVEFFPDGNRVLLHAPKKVSILRLDGEPAHFPVNLGHFATLSPDGKLLAICGNSSEVVIADAESGSTVHSLSQPNASPTFAGFNRRGDQLFVVYDKRSIRVWDLERGESVTPLLTDGAEEIRAATFSTDGRYLIAADDQPGIPDLILAWDLQGPLEAKRSTTSRYIGLQATQLRAADGFACVPEDVFVNVVSLATGQRRYPRLAHADMVRSSRISPDGSRIASCGNDHTARIWDARSGKAITNPLHHNSAVVVAEFSPDGTHLVTGTVEGEIAIWSVKEARRVMPMMRHPDRIWAARFTPDGRRLITSSLSGTRVWDLAGAAAAPSLVRQLSTWGVGCEFVSSSQSDPWLVAAGQRRIIPTFDLRSKAVVGPPIRAEANVCFAALHPNTESLFAACFDGEVSLSRISDGKTIFRTDRFRLSPEESKQEIDGISFNPQGIPHLQSNIGAAFDDDGRWIVVHNNYTGPDPHYSQLMTLDAKTGAPLSEFLDFDGPINGSSITPNGKYWVGVTGRRFFPHFGCRTEIRALPSLELVRRIDFEAPVLSVDVSRDGRRLLLGVGKDNDVGFAQVYDFETGTPISRPIDHQTYVEHVQFLTNNKHVLSKSRSGEIRLSDIQTGDPVAPAIHIARLVTGLAVSPDERWLAIGTGTNNANGRTEQHLRYFDLATGEPISPPIPHGDGFSVSISGDGRMVATFGRDGYVKAFEVPHTESPLEDMKQLVAVVSGLRLDEAENLLPVDAKRFEEYWSVARNRFPNEFAATTDEENVWLRNQVEIAQASKDLTKAVELLDDLISLDPKDPELYRRRIWLKSQLGRYESMPSDAETLQEVLPHSGADLAELAQFVAVESEAANELNRYALALADRAVARSPEDPETWRYRAEVHRKMGATESAIADLKKVVELQPGNFRPWYELALLQLTIDDRQGYEQTCKRMIQSVPPSGVTTIDEFVAWTSSLAASEFEDWEPLIERAEFVVATQSASVSHRKALGAVHLRAGNYGQAYEELIEADRLLNDPSSSMQSSPAYPWYLLAITSKTLGFDGHARSWYQKAREWSDKAIGEGRNDLPWVRLATLDLLEREAATALEIAPSIDESNPQVWLGRAAVHRYLGNQDAAQEAIDQAVKLAGESPDRWVQQEISRAQAGTAVFDEMTTLLNTIERHPTHIESWRKLVDLQHRLGDADRLRAVVHDGLNSLSEANRFSAAETHQLREFALAIGRLGFHDESIAMLEATSASWERLRKADPKNPALAKHHAHTLRMLANVHAGTDKERYLSQAVSSAQLAIELIREHEVPKNVIADAHSILGELYRVQGRPNDALRELEKALALNPQNAGTHHRLVSWFQGASPMEPVHKRKAAQHAITAFDLKPDFPSAPNKCEACVNALQESIEKGESGDALSHYLVAAGLRRLGHLGGAVAYWQRAEELMSATKTPLDDETSKWRDEVRASITHLLDDQGRLKARYPVSKGDPGWQRNVDLLVDYGTALQELGRLNEAIEAYDELLAIAPDSYVVSLARGNAYLAQGRYDDAISDLSRANEASDSTKQEFDALYARAKAYLQHEEMGSATADLEQARALLPKLTPEDVILAERFHLACYLCTAYLQSGQQEKARNLSNELRSQYASDPDPWSKQMVAWYFTMVPSLVDDWKEVVELSRDDVALHPDWCWSQLTLAWTLLFSEDYDAAAALLDEIKPVAMDLEEIEMVRILIDFKRNPSPDAQAKLDQLEEGWKTHESLLRQYRLQNAKDMMKGVESPEKPEENDKP